MNFDQPKQVTGADVAFGPKDINELLPKYSHLPDEFKCGNKYTKMASTWFYNGIKSITFKKGIDRTDALGHLKATLGSFEPKHEHKIAGVGYSLMTSMSQN